VNERAIREKKLAAEKAKAGEAKAGGGGNGGGKALPGMGRKEKPAAPEPIPPPKAVPPRSKIPESVIRRLAEAAAGVVELTPEQKLAKKIGSPCAACGTTAANTLCLGCHAVYCAPCCAVLHEVNKQLTVENGHSPEVREVQEKKEGLEAVAEDHRIACTLCQRKFDPMRIAKHQIVCASQDRKVVKVKHATDMRVKGTEFETFLKKKGVLKGGVLIEKEPVPVAPSRWRQQHDQIQAVAGASNAASSSTVTTAAPTTSTTAAATTSSSSISTVSGSLPVSVMADVVAGETSVEAGEAKAPAPQKPKLPRVGDKVKIEEKNGVTGCVLCSHVLTNHRWVGFHIIITD